MEEPIKEPIKGQIDQPLFHRATTTILGGLCFICANKVAPGHIRHLDYGQVLIGEHHQHYQIRPLTPLLNDIVADFKRANIAIKTTEDLPMARWQKLVWNVPYNGLSVVLNATTEEMMADSGITQLITTLMEEVVCVANHWGQQYSTQTPSFRGASADSSATSRALPSGLISQMLSHTEQMTPYRTSMKIDYDEGRPLEIEAILGNPIRVAQTLGIPVPNMRMLYQQLAFLNARNLLC
ncbi:MAG: 2-dehydropantoate 2-reductase [Phormidesmis sp. RL_2_1]|nr:2-dehydropantoate 2-reductase [Phormidesmis sp. RL_2_1]